MSETSTTQHTPSPEVATAIVAHGLMALGLHMADHPGLPLYTGIRTPDRTTYDQLDRIELHVTGPDRVEAWVASIDVDNVRVEPRGEGAGSYPFHRLYFGRLPATGVRVVIEQLLAAIPLEAVRS